MMSARTHEGGACAPVLLPPQTYYYNRETGETRWTKVRAVSVSHALQPQPRPHPLLLAQPLLLGNETLTPRPFRRKLKRKKAKDMTDEEAASMLQRIYRRKRAMRRMRAMIRQLYRAAVDPNSGNTCVATSLHGVNCCKPHPAAHDQVLLQHPNQESAVDQGMTLFAGCGAHLSHTLGNATVWPALAAR